MDVKIMPLLPHNHMEELKNQQNHLLSVIAMAKTAKQGDEMSSLPPLHSLMARLDAVQGLKELESFSHFSRPAFVVDINSSQRELSEYAQDAFTVELNSL